MTSAAALQLMDSVLLCCLIWPLSLSFFPSLLSISYYSMPFYLSTSLLHLYLIFITLGLYLPLFLSMLFCFISLFFPVSILPTTRNQTPQIHYPFLKMLVKHLCRAEEVQLVTQEFKQTN